MPWSAKAVELLKSQNAADSVTGKSNLKPVLESLLKINSSPASGDQSTLCTLIDQCADTLESIERFIATYRRKCSQTDTVQDWRIAPFHLLATEGKVYSDKSHQWHLKQIESLCHSDQSLICKTDHLMVDVSDKVSVENGLQWWLQKTSAGSEGMVVKPLDWIVRSSTGLVQPAIKCRGKEYLRILYGPDYDTQENIAILRKRGLGRKRSLCIKEFALGLEALERFVQREPSGRVHECIFGVLALKSEPVDPRL
jgi:protein phosphatase